MLFAIIACSTNNTESQDNTLYEVEIGEAIQTKQEAFTSNIINGDIEYVALESGKDHLLGPNPHLYLTDTEIIAFAKRQIFIFNRTTGKFLREIGHYGKDPAGYKKVVHSFPYDASNEVFYTQGWDPKSYYRYTSEGNFKDKLSAYSIDLEDDLANNVFSEMVTSIAPLNDTCFVGYVWNINGKQKTKLIVFNENNHRIKTFPQNQSFEYDINKNGINVFRWEGWFYQFDKHLNFFERFSDTVYTVTAAELKPKFVLNQAKDLEAPYTNRYLPEYDASQYFMVDNIFESANFLFFKTRYNDEANYGFFKKNEKTTRVSIASTGICNDTDNFIPFKFYSANNKNEIIGCQEAYEVNLWFNTNKEKIGTLTPKLQKLKSIQENDNPLVMIAKLKTK